MPCLDKTITQFIPSDRDAAEALVEVITFPRDFPRVELAARLMHWRVSPVKLAIGLPLQSVLGKVSAGPYHFLSL